jgi:hypothetical protein
MKCCDAHVLLISEILLMTGNNLYTLYRRIMCLSNSHSHISMDIKQFNANEEDCSVKKKFSYEERIIKKIYVQYGLSLSC